MEVRALYSWPDHYLTSQFANEIGFFQRVFAEKPSPSCVVTASKNTRKFQSRAAVVGSFYYN